jgi:glyoxylase I family protein
MIITAVDHVEICVRDVDAVAEFYKKLGFIEIRRTTHHGGAVELKLPGDNQMVFEFHNAKDYEETPGLNHFGFRVDNIEQAVADAKAQGIEFITDIMTAKSTGRKVANFRDPSYMRNQLTTKIDQK